MPKLIILYAFAGVGKSTVAKLYADDHPMSMNLEGDIIINSLGDYFSDYDEARRLVYLHTLSMVKTHLEAGYDVILPYLLLEASQAVELRNLAESLGCECHEVYMNLPKVEALARLKSRGRWGEEGSPVLDEAEMVKAEKLFDRMAIAMAPLTDVVDLDYHMDSPELTYASLKNVLLR